MIKYSIQWATQYDDQTWYQELRDLVAERIALIVPKCGCYAIKIRNKIKYRKEIAALEQQMNELTGE